MRLIKIRDGLLIVVLGILGFFILFFASEVRIVQKRSLFHRCGLVCHVQFYSTKCTSALALVFSVLVNASSAGWAVKNHYFGRWDAKSIPIYRRV